VPEEASEEKTDIGKGEESEGREQVNSVESAEKEEEVVEDFLKFSSGQDHERGEVPDQAETRHQQEEDPLNHKVEGVSQSSDIISNYWLRINHLIELIFLSIILK